MARDTEQLVLQLSADLRSFQKEMLRASGEADRAAQRVERRFQQMNRQITRDFNNFSNDVRGVLAAIGVGVVVRDVTELGDVWIRVGNALAFAGVKSGDLADTQQLVADIASRTRSDLEATADLFARMYRSSEDLGASMADVLAVTEIVSKALAGASQSERAGAIRQLGQGLGSGRLQGDELRSILENSRPISEAIAREFETTVGNLRKLGQEGRLESRRVFEAIRNAGADIEEAYARTTFTVADSFTRLRTEAARFVGTNEQTSSSTRALTRLIDYAANNFEMLADAAIIAATVIGGAFAGQAVARAVTAVAALTANMTAAGGAAAALSRGLAFFGGPLGIALTAAGAGMAYLATQTDVFASRAELLGRAEDSLYSALQIIAGLEVASDDAADQIGRAADETGRVADEANRAAGYLDDLTDSTDDVAEGMSVQERAARDLSEAQRENTLRTIEQAIADREALVAAEQRAQRVRSLANILGALGDPAEQDLRLEQNDRLNREGQAEIERQQERIDFLRGVLERLERGQLVRPSDEAGAGGAGGAAGAGATDPGARTRRQTIEDLQRQAELNLARLRHEEARIRVLEDAEQIEKRTTAYVSAGLALADARVQAESEVRAEREAMNAEALRSLEISQAQDQIELARLRNNIGLADQLSDELEIRRRTRDLVDQMALSEEEALRIATEWVQLMREARELDRAQALERRALEDDLDIARARGDERAERAIERRLELEERIAELRQFGLSEEAATARARDEVAALEQADMQGKFREWFRGGVSAAIEGDLGEFFENWLRERAAAGLESALNDVADLLFNAFRDVLSGVMQSGSEGLGSAIASIFSPTSVPGFGGGMIELDKSAADAASALGTVLSAAAADAASKLALGSAVAAASAAKDAANATIKGTAVTAEVFAMNALTKAALAAANALGQVATQGGGGSSTILSTIASSFLRFGGARMAGGPVMGGAAYLVGEGGPEFFVPKQPGTIIPNGGFGGATIQIVDKKTINFTGTSEEMRQLRQILAEDQATRDLQVRALVNDQFSRRQILR
jgi:tape measure domain-containing protein